VTIDDLLKKVSEYNPEEVDKVKKAYEVAALAHNKQFRESGEPYIIHPLHVAMNLTEFYADGSTLCAGLLHDVVEDTDYTLEDIRDLFGDEVALLVEGVTKISNLHFSTKSDASNANIRRLINSLNTDVRIIIIKLCDRLHNIRTLEFKAPEKRIRSAEETLNIFVPIAYFIGAFRLKCELEDICLSYLDNESYVALTEKVNEIEKDYQNSLAQARKDVKKIFKEHNINYSIREKILNVYHIYKKLNKGYKLNNIHDLVNVKVIVPDDVDPYQVLGLIHKLYTPMNNKFKDYIACPKTNMYRSLHTTVFGPDNHLLQYQIKTESMDLVNTIGLAAYWKFHHGKGQEKMQSELKMNYQFFSTIRDINDVIESDSDFIDKVKEEIFSNNIYVYTLTGEVIELPNNSTVIDFAYKLHTDLGNHLYKAYINGKEVKLNHKLNSKDRIMIVPRDKSKPQSSWLKYVVTSKARRNIKEALK
jgi:GTP pyrophosphokinase